MWNSATAAGLNGLEAGMPEHSCHQGPVLSPADEIRNSWGPKEGSGSCRFPYRWGRACPAGRAWGPARQPRSAPGRAHSISRLRLRAGAPAGAQQPQLCRSPTAEGGAELPLRRCSPRGLARAWHRSRSCRSCLTRPRAARAPSRHVCPAFTSSVWVNI